MWRQLQLVDQLICTEMICTELLNCLPSSPDAQPQVHADAEYDNQGCGQKLQDGSAGPKFNTQGGWLTFQFAGVQIAAIKPRILTTAGSGAGGTFIAEWDPVVTRMNAGQGVILKVRSRLRRFPGEQAPAYLVLPDGSGRAPSAAALSFA